ncbi:hypothetical protein VRK_05540 [Vibrio sp. MEBiC08052]|nr:hypothetical protein VRK_05540 [Vibrio sp. MEBiC08052]
MIDGRNDNNRKISRYKVRIGRLNKPLDKVKNSKLDEIKRLYTVFLWNLIELTSVFDCYLPE